MITTSNFDKAKSEIKKSIPQITFAAIVVLAFSLFAIYGTFSEGQLFSQQGVGIAFGLISSLLWFVVLVMLKRENKHALTFTLLAFCLVYARMIFIDKTFTLNVFSIFALCFFGFYIIRLVMWIRAGALR
jgi:hypothetical protein